MSLLPRTPARPDGLCPSTPAFKALSPTTPLLDTLCPRTPLATSLLPNTPDPNPRLTTPNAGTSLAAKPLNGSVTAPGGPGGPGGPAGPTAPIVTSASTSCEEWAPTIL